MWFIKKVVEDEEGIQQTPSSSRILAFGFNSRSYGLLRWLRTRRRCLSSTGFSWVTSGSTTLHRLVSVMNVDDIDGVAGG